MRKRRREVSPIFATIRPRTPQENQKSTQSQFGQKCDIKKAGNIYFLPPYSPELNLIEIVWKKITHQWLPLQAYKSAQSLWDELGAVLAEIGKKL
ncbi:transposase [Stieleria varia]|uniref:transposase n=1 Tax=Stieleria varia TaxID=2528005 RepID=UPI0018D20507